MSDKEIKNWFKQYKRDINEEKTIIHNISNEVKKLNELGVSFDETKNIGLIYLIFNGTITVKFLKEKNLIDIWKDINVSDIVKMSNELLSTVRTVVKINDEILSFIYGFIMSFEISLNKFILYTLNKNNISIFEVLKFNEMQTWKIEKKLISKFNDKINSNKIENRNINENKFLDNSQLLNELYFSELILIFDLMYKNNLITFNDLLEKNFISKEKYNFLFKIHYKGFQTTEEKNKLIFDNHIKEMIRESKNYRNAISHNDLLIINKDSCSRLLKYLNNVSDILRKTTTAKDKIEKIKEIIERELNKNKKFIKLRNIYSKFLNNN